MARWIVWATSGGPKDPGGEKRTALFYVEAEHRADAVALVEGLDLTSDLKPGQRAKVNNQPAADTGQLARRP